MAEEADAGTAQGAGATESHGDDDAAQGAAGDAQGAASEGASDTVEALTAKLADLEKENRSYRSRIKAAEAKAKTAEESGSTEAERLAARVTDLEKTLAERESAAREQSLRLASISAATRLGFRNPDLAYRLLDPSAMEIAEDGTPRNVEKLLSALAKAEPYLLSASDFGGGQRGTSAAASSDDMDSILRRAAGRAS